MNRMAWAVASTSMFAGAAVAGSGKITTRLEWPVFGVWTCEGEGKVTGTFAATPADDGSWNVAATFRRQGVLTCWDIMPGDGGTWTVRLHGKGETEFNAFSDIPITLGVDFYSGSGPGDGFADYWVTVVVGADGVVSVPTTTATAADASGDPAGLSGSPFEGSWAGVYEVPDLDAEGTVEFRISRTGVLEGRSLVDTEGDYHTLTATVNSDGQMRGIAIPSVHGYAQTYSGDCLIDESGSMVCDLTGCIQYDCFGFLVTVDPVADASGSVGAIRSREQSGACEAGSYSGGTTGGGWIGGGSQKEAKQSAIAYARVTCAEHCAALDACPANKPACHGSARVGRLDCGVSVYFGTWTCSGDYTCDCRCSGD